MTLRRTLSVAALVMSVFALCGHKAAAAIYRFSPEEHKPILALSQQFAIEPLDVPEDAADFFIEYRDQGSAPITIQVLPRGLSYRFRVFWYTEMNSESRLMQLYPDGRREFVPIETKTSAGYTYVVNGSTFAFDVEDYAPSTTTLTPSSRTIGFTAEGIEYAIQNHTILGDAAGRLLESEPMGLPDGLQALSPAYRLAFDQADLVAGSVPTKVKIRYTETNDASKFIYYFDETVNVWRSASSYNNVEERTVTATVPSITSTFILLSSSESRDGIASWYSYRKCPCAASVRYPKGTKVKVTRLKTGKSIVVTINDYGPEAWTGRLIDLDATAFKKIGALNAGLIYVAVEPVSPTTSP